MVQKTYQIDYDGNQKYIPDPDEEGETWEGMYKLMRCPLPRC